MKFNQLTTKKSRPNTRVGRGISGGKGKTAGRGTKGQGARKSGGTRPGFEGGQMPLYMRLPKLRGFKSKRAAIENVYTGQLESLKGTVIDNLAVFEAGLTSSPYVKVKVVVGDGELKSKKDVKLQGASASAIQIITNAGGSFSETTRVARQAKKDKSVE